MMVSETVINKSDDPTKDMKQSTKIVFTFLQDMRVYGKKIKKVADAAEDEIEKLDRQIKKAQKELKKAAALQSDNPNSKKVAKIKEYELQLRKRRREEMVKVLSQLQEEFQRSQEILIKLKSNIFQKDVV
jgi:hypothetical protein